MIPAIGLMIGCYIIVRMGELLLVHPRTGAFGLLKVFAIGTMAVCLLGMMDLVLGSIGATLKNLSAVSALAETQTAPAGDLPDLKQPENPSFRPQLPPSPFQKR